MRTLRRKCGAATTPSSSERWRWRRRRVPHGAAGNRGWCRRSRRSHSCGTRSDCSWITSLCIWLATLTQRKNTKTTITAASITTDLLRQDPGGGIHRQEHGSGQGPTETPQKWIAVADIAISVARSASTSPVALPVDATRTPPLLSPQTMCDGAVWPPNDAFAAPIPLGSSACVSSSNLMRHQPLHWRRGVGGGTL